MSAEFPPGSSMTGYGSLDVHGRVGDIHAVHHQGLSRIGITGLGYVDYVVYGLFSRTRNIDETEVACNVGECDGVGVFAVCGNFSRLADRQRGLRDRCVLVQVENIRLQIAACDFCLGRGYFECSRGVEDAARHRKPGIGCCRSDVDVLLGKDGTVRHIRGTIESDRTR